MVYQLVFTAKADQDLTKIKIWYDGINIKLTQELFSELGKELRNCQEIKYAELTQ